jgi:hypothetical protein
MRYRIELWTCAGFLIAASWALYAFATQPPALTSADPLWTLAQITCPIAFASMHFHFGVSLYWCLIANAVTYALIGVAVETLRKTIRIRRVI